MHIDFSTVLARLIHGTRVIDRGHHLFCRLREEAVLALASDRALERYNDLVYGVSPTYTPGTSRFRAGLFEWEREAIDRWFPPPPARILIGGAGGGRESVSLASRGYSITALVIVSARLHIPPVC